MRIVPLTVLAMSVCGAPSSNPSPDATPAPSDGDALRGLLSTSGEPACADENEVERDGYGAFAESVVGGGDQTCARLRGGAVRCWGADDRGQLGTCSSPEAPPLPRLVSAHARAVATGPLGTCAARVDGALTCSGSVRTLIGAHGPGLIAGIGEVVGVAVGEQHVCALSSSAMATCFGHWTAIETVGPDPVGLDEGTPSGRVAGRLALPGARMIAAGSHHTCALDGQGQVSCWGRNGSGQLGDPRVGERLDDNRGALRRVAGMPRIEDIAAAGDLSCAVTEAREVYCWGDGFGARARQLQAPPAVDVAVGPGFVCYAQDGGGVGCQGEPPPGLSAIASLGVAVEVAVGRRHLCVRREDGTVRCLGANDLGQLGVGHTAPVDRAMPALLDGVPL